MNTKENFAKAVRTVLMNRGMSLDQLKEGAPFGFWTDVVRELVLAGVKKEKGGDWNDKQAAQYWARNKSKFIEIVDSQEKSQDNGPAKGSVTDIVPTNPNSENEATDYPTGCEPDNDTNNIPKPPNSGGVQKPGEPMLPPDPESIKELSELTEEIIEMLQWWRGKKDQQIHLGEARPILDGGEGQKNTGVKVDVKILRMAAEKAEKERAQTGGSVSKLVELLLWKYLGEPEEFIVR